MTTQVESLNIYRLTRKTAERPRDSDLVTLAEHFPQMIAVLEEVQGLRQQRAELKRTVEFLKGEIQ